MTYDEMTAYANMRTELYVNDEGEIATVRILSAPIRTAYDEQNTMIVLNRLDVEEPRILHKPLREICRTRDEVVRLQALHNAELDEQLRKMKVEERKAFTKLFTYTIRWFCNVALVVLVILKVTDNIGWNMWLVLLSGCFLVNITIDIIIAYRFNK